MTKSAGDRSARVTVTALDRAREVVPTSELEPPTPAEESTVQNSRPRFSIAGAIGTIVNGTIALGAATLAGVFGQSEGRRPAGCWLGAALAVAGGLLLVIVVWPALMHGWRPGAGPAIWWAQAAPFACLPARREVEIDVPAPDFAPVWLPAPEREREPAAPVPAPAPEPVEVPA